METAAATTVPTNAALSPDTVEKEARFAVHAWNDTVAPQLMPQAQDLWKQANDLWHAEKHQLHQDAPKQRVDEIPEQFAGAWQTLLAETAALQQQVEALKARLVEAKAHLNALLHPDCTKYQSAILKLPFFQVPCPDALQKLDHYYNFQFLQHYENAMVEYEELLGYPTGLLRRVQNVRKYEVHEMELQHRKEHKTLLPFL